MFHLHRNLVGGIGWSLCAMAFFAEFGSRSPAGWAMLAVVSVMPPLVYTSLAGGPPATVAQVLYDAENGR